MAKTSTNQIEAVKRYQAKCKRFTMLFREDEYRRLSKAIAPATMSGYVRGQIDDDMRKRALIKQVDDTV